MAIDAGSGGFIKAFPDVTLNEVAGCLHYAGTAKTVADMNNDPLAFASDSISPMPSIWQIADSARHFLLLTRK